MTWFKTKWQQILKTPHRLSTLFATLITIWLVGGILLIGISLHLSWRLEERGITINEVGSLRKQCFHMFLLSETSQIEQLVEEHDEFMRILQKISLFSQRKFHNEEQYQRFLAQLMVIKQKALIVLPYFSDPHKKELQENPLTLSALEEFVESISLLVDIVEQDNTERIILLRWLQVIILLIAISSSILSFLFLRRLVVKPLTKLSAGIQKVRKGDFQTHIDIRLKNELGEIAEGFNQMSSNLAHMYQDLETIVSEKTEELQKRHQDLTFLYRISSLLQQTKDIDVIASQFLQLVMEFTAAKGGIIRLLNSSKKNTEVIASAGFESDILNADQCIHLKDCYCGIALIKQQKIYRQDFTEDADIEALCQEYQLNHLVSFKLAMSDETLGTLNLFFHEADDFITEDSHLIENAIREFCLVLESLRFEQLERQMFVLEERNFMAQGLHDSIAQSLSFLNIQTQLLTKAIANDQSIIRDQALTFIKEGVQESYDNVRELLLNFRVSLNPGNFADSIQNVIDRFKRQSNTTVDYHYLDQGRELLPETQLQVIFILQEALSNIRKHAEATLVSVKIEQLQERFSLSVIDDGIGFDEDTLIQKKNAGHIGTLIMEERANKANGVLDIHSVVNKGTTISLIIHRTDITHTRNQ